MKKTLKGVLILLVLLFLTSCKKKDDSVEVKNPDEDYLTLSITEIDKDYFLAGHPWPSPNQYKVFVKLGEEYCVGDYIDVEYETISEATEDGYLEVEATSWKESDFELQDGVCYKPVIYLYPLEPKEVTVTIDLKGTLTKSYPTYENGWKVTAFPDGTLVDDQGTQYPYLFWEGETNAQYDMSKGFCVAGKDSETFLVEKLSFMGLNDKERTDYLEFWLPFLEKNPYNIIAFQTDCYTDNAVLQVQPQPDSVLRIFMVYQPSEKYVQIKEQQLSKFNREGFTVVEWGGGIMK